MKLTTQMQIHENEARRLRTEYAGDLLVRLLVELDLAIRRTASRVRSLISDDPACRSEWQ